MSLVSIIIPVFNRASVLERALNSVLRQSFTRWELIVVDDGSTDGSGEIFKRWRAAQNLTQTVRYFKTENGGVSRARNFGVRNSSAPWLAFLDSDDEWLPEKLERQMALSQEFQLIHGEEIWIRNGVRVNPMKKHAKSGGEIFRRCVEICCISPSTSLIRRELFTRMRGFREDFPVCEDYELWLRITHERPVGFVPDPVQIKYGGNPDQLSLRYPAMDYYRIKALIPFLNSSEHAEYIARNILARAEILLQGYVKYPNPAKQREVEEWRQDARRALTQVQSVHSAAESLPLSLESVSL